MGSYKIQVGENEPVAGEKAFPDHGAAIRAVEEALGGFGGLAAVGFKPVMARGISGTQFLDDRVLAAMEEISCLLPAHNPPYIAGVRQFNSLYPGLPCIGTFETAFYDHVPRHNRRFPIPHEWEEKFGIARYGFHGASHRYVTERCAELRGTDQLRLISCHLGGSSSMAAVVNGRAINSSWGMTAQSGLPQNNRSGDFDCFAMMYLARECGLGWEAVEKSLASQSGLKGMSGLSSGDMRDLRDAAASGNTLAAEAIEVFVASIRKFLGQFLLEMGGADTLIFTAGIGENDHALRARICENLEWIGLNLDPAANAKCAATEAVISTPDSRIEVRVIPTNEEVVIARNAWTLLHER
jgi:acetate kinase